MFRKPREARIKFIRYVMLVSILALNVFMNGALAQFTNEDAPELPAQLLDAAQRDFTNWEYTIGDFRVSWQGNDNSDAQLVVSSLAQPQQSHWQSLPGSGFVLAAIASVDAQPGTGYSHMQEQVDVSCSDQTVSNGVNTTDYLTIAGTLSCATFGEIDYILKLSQMGEGQLQFDLAFDSNAIGRAGLLFTSRAEERVFGFGEQYSSFDFKVRRIPIMVDEQGLSRGADLALIIPAPIGTPAVLYRQGSVVGEHFRQKMIDS